MGEFAWEPASHRTDTQRAAIVGQVQDLVSSNFSLAVNWWLGPAGYTMLHSSVLVGRRVADLIRYLNEKKGEKHFQK
jgi:hypothetical protein